MKKFVVTIFAFFYLCLSTGATVHLHYCMGKLVEWSLWQNGKKDKCGKCGMAKSEKKKGCCKDEQKPIKLINDQKATTNDFQIFKASFSVITSSFIESSEEVISLVADKNPVSHSPPRSTVTGIYLLNCVFRI